MKIIPLKGGDEYDALTRFKKYLRWRPGQRKAIKRRFNKQVRQELSAPVEAEQARTKTIRCEGCCGVGIIPEPLEFLSIGRRRHDYNWAECPLCQGTGLEPADVQARDAVEGRARA